VRLLALDTATELCSAALWLDGVVSVCEAVRPRGHGELILPMIEQLLGRAGLCLHELDAIAFGRGPGAFTGVRLAASIAQGLAFALDLPLLPVSDLRALAAQALARPAAPTRVLICQDARMDEVYWGCFEQAGDVPVAVGPEGLGAAQSVALPPAWEHSNVCGAGSGFAAYSASLSALAGELSPVMPELRPHAREIALLAAHAGLDCAVPPEQGEPVYLRDVVTAGPVR